VIYVPKNKVNKYRKINNMTFAEKQKMIGKTITNQAPQTTVTSSDMQNFIIYTVKSGDTLWDIAKKYPGVTDTDIMRLNNLNNGDRISPGQKLKIKPKG
jgi:membrane-bound lytic murein transglycosylase D